MEKLVYVLWKRGDEPDQAFADRLLGEAAPRLLALPDRVERLTLSVVDDAVASGEKLRIGTMRPAKSALATCWVEQRQDRGGIERVLAGVCGRFAGYLVAESRPLVNRSARPGARSPGFALVTGIVARADIAYDEFLRVWYDEHRACALETQSTFGYVRNEIVRVLTPDAPQWTAIVEENFPAAALTDPAAFYDAVGDPAKLQRNAERMMKTCEKFLDLTKIESHPMSEWAF
jgi:hypothetical protein